MHEKGIADQYEEVVLNMLEKGDQKSWKHHKLNPQGETPALKLADGTVLSESTGIARYLDNVHPGRKIMGENPLEQGLDQSWDQKIWVHLLYRLTVAFHVLHQGLGPDLELTKNEAWGEHCRKEALAMGAQMNQHFSDGRSWVLGGNEPTFSDITLCTAIAFGKFGPMHTDLTHRFEFLDKYWQRWQERDSFKKAYSDGGMLDELKHLVKK